MVMPFSNGSEYTTWIASNCECCSKYSSNKNFDYTCKILEAIDEAFYGDEMPEDIFKRMGKSSGRCTELTYPWYVTGKTEQGECLVFGPFNTEKEARAKYENRNEVITWLMARGKKLVLDDFELKVEQMPTNFKGQVTIIEESIKEYEQLEKG